MAQLGSMLREYARRVFLESADYDYIAARALFDIGLRDQFWWAALQAMEKYFKAILLFNLRSARYVDRLAAKKQELGHDLEALCRAVMGIGYLRFTPSQKYLHFIKFLTAFGNNRYLSVPTFLSRQALLLLDESVWFTRRFCQDVNWIWRRDGHPPRPLRRQAVDGIHAAQPHGNQRLFLIGGRLEAIRKRAANDPMRRALIRANCYFGTRRTGVPVNRLINAAWPPAFPSDPALLKKLKEYVKL